MEAGIILGPATLAPVQAGYLSLKTFGRAKALLYPLRIGSLEIALGGIIRHWHIIVNQILS